MPLVLSKVRTQDTERTYREVYIQTSWPVNNLNACNRLSIRHFKREGETTPVQDVLEAIETELKGSMTIIVQSNKD